MHFFGVKKNLRSFNLIWFEKLFFCVIKFYLIEFNNAKKNGTTMNIIYEIEMKFKPVLNKLLMG